MKSTDAVRIFVGYDPREAIAYHVFCQSLIEHSNAPLIITPLALTHLNDIYREKHEDGSNQFIYSRFLVPHLSNFLGTSLFFDGDMIVETDIVGEIIKLTQNSDKAVHVVKHDYKTKFSTKYFGNKNENYPRKNWSSVIAFNNVHIRNRLLTPEFVAAQTGAYLHRFSWLDDDQVGDLPIAFNWLVGEYPTNKNAKLLHYTLGIPSIQGFQNSNQADQWFRYLRVMNKGLEIDHPDG
jgi:hypothetical protein